MHSHLKLFSSLLTGIEMKINSPISIKILFITLILPPTKKNVEKIINFYQDNTYINSSQRPFFNQIQ